MYFLAILLPRRVTRFIIWSLRKSPLVGTWFFMSTPFLSTTTNPHMWFYLIPCSCLLSHRIILFLLHLLCLLGLLVHLSQRSIRLQLHSPIHLLFLLHQFPLLFLPILLTHNHYLLILLHIPEDLPEFLNLPLTSETMFFLQKLSLLPTLVLHIGVIWFSSLHFLLCISSPYITLILFMNLILTRRLLYILIGFRLCKLKLILSFLTTLRQR